MLPKVFQLDLMRMDELYKLEKVYQANSTGSLEIGMVFIRRYANRIERPDF